MAVIIASPVAHGDTWIPSTMAGTVSLLDEGGADLGEKTIAPVQIEVVRSSDGSFERREQNGRPYLKVRWTPPNGNTLTFWVEEDHKDFQYTHQQCLQSKLETSMAPQTHVMKFFESNIPEAGHMSSRPMPVRIRQPQCSQIWTEGCVRDYNSNWRPAWIYSRNIQACREGQTEAGTRETDCDDCGNRELQGTSDSLSEIARRARQSADAQLTRLVPENLHDIAERVVRSCFPYANYLVQKMDLQTFRAYTSLPNGLNPAKTAEDVKLCEAVLSKPAGQRSPISACYGIAQACNQPGQFKGWCLRGVRKILQDAGMVSVDRKNRDLGVLGGQAKTAGSALKRCGFENMIDTFRIHDPPFFTNLPPGAVLIYNDPTNSRADGHAEVFTGSQYCSDFCSNRPISEYRSGTRVPIGVYIKTRDVSAKECLL